MSEPIRSSGRRPAPRGTVPTRTYRVLVTYPQTDAKGRPVVRHRIMTGLTRSEVIRRVRTAAKQAGHSKVAVSATQIGGPKSKPGRDKSFVPGGLIDWDAVNGGRKTVDIDHILGF